MFGDDTLGWTGLSFDTDGALFAVSRVLSQQDLFQHLYRINPATGGVIADLGSLGTERLGDIPFAAGTLYGNIWDLPCDCGGQLITVDTADAAIDFVTGSGGFGLNPFDTIEGLHIHRGGSAVHPVSGDLWGIEAAGSNAPIVYRINSTTGAADSTLLLGMNGDPLPYPVGFDGLAILADGTFIAVKGIPNAHPDSILYAFEPTPDSLGLVQLRLIPLSYDTALAGKINGLTLAPVPADPSVVLDCDELEPLRAETIACTATPIDLQGTISFEWVFRPDTIVVFPGQNADKLVPSANIPGPSGASSDSWGGRIVTSGWIVVTATTPSEGTVADSQHIVVQARTGAAWETTESIVGPMQRPDLETANHPVVSPARLIGANLHVDGSDIFDWSGIRTDAPVISDNGPNHGYIYVQSSEYRWDRSYWLNPHITPSGPVHAVYQGQKNHWNGLLAIVPSSNPQTLLDGVTAHERYGAGAGAGHQGRMRDALVGEQCGNINRLMEQVVGTGATFVALVSQVRQESLGYLDVEAQESNVGNNYAGAEAVSGTNPVQQNGQHVYNATLHDMKLFTNSGHTQNCS